MNTYPRRIFVKLYDFLFPRGQQVGTILLNIFSWEWFIFKISLIKFLLLIWSSDKIIIFRKIKLILGLQNWPWKLKMSNFSQSSIKRSYKISKNPFKRLIYKQKSIKIHLHHWKIPCLSPYYCSVHFCRFLNKSSCTFHSHFKNIMNIFDSRYISKKAVHRFCKLPSILGVSVFALFL